MSDGRLDEATARDVLDSMRQGHPEPMLRAAVVEWALAEIDGWKSMHFVENTQRGEAEAEVKGLRDAIRHAIDVLGPGDEEDGDSPSNMAFAILGHALSRGETNA